MDASKAGACHLQLIVDSSSIMKTPASAWTFRIDWAPLVTAKGQWYHVKLTDVETGKRHTFRTPDDLPGVTLLNREVREKVGDTFSVQIRLVDRDGVGEWSETSEVLSVAKASPNWVTVYTVSRKAPVEKCGDVAKRHGSVLDRFMAKFRRSCLTDVAKRHGSVLDPLHV